MYILIDGLKSESELLKEITGVLQGYYVGISPPNTPISTVEKRIYEPDVVVPEAGDEEDNGFSSALHLMDLTKQYLEETIEVTREHQRDDKAIAIRVGSPISMHVWFSGVLAENMKSELFYHILPRFEDIANLEVPDTLILLDCINPKESDADEMEKYRNISAVIPGGMAYMNLVREFEENRKTKQARHYKGIDHPTSRKTLYGSLVHVPYELGESVHHIATRLIGALSVSPIEGKHLVDIKLDELEIAQDVNE